MGCKQALDAIVQPSNRSEWSDDNACVDTMVVLPDSRQANEVSDVVGQDRTSLRGREGELILV
jgi:hypothetical protein